VKSFELEVSGFEALPGRGAVAAVSERSLWAGGPRLAAEQGAELPVEFENLQARGETAVALGQGSEVLAIFGLADEPRIEASSAVEGLRERAGINEVVMLTGDSEPVAAAIAKRSGITRWRAGLLPEDKLDQIKRLESEVGPTAMVGDGVNDSPALAGSTVGVAMGAAGSDVALDSADVALMGDDLMRLPDAINHSRWAVRIMKQNVSVSLITKAIFVVLAPLGFVSLITAIAVDMGVSLLVTLNGLRLLRRPATHSLRETPGDPGPVAVAATAEGDVCEEDCCSP
ncbi:MAG TPA: HAD-IC family P-type ATPase, partial [Solirubrobacterales bacterium]|nr:HAD-IC family P-type ATPase [Solirubrobacterales bacterium]